MESQFKIRPLDPETDFPRLAELINAVNSSQYDPEQVRAMLTWPGHDLARDHWVAEASGRIRIAGQAWIFAQTPARSFVQVDVHPGDRWQGLGTRLLNHARQAAVERGAKQLTAAVSAGDVGSQAFLRKNGFEPAGEVRFFNSPEEIDLPVPELPAGFTLRGGDALDVQDYVDACNRCYADMWGHYENLEPLTVGQLEAWHGADFERGGMQVIYGPDSRPAGVTWAKHEGEGEQARWVIDAPGAAPEYRSLGLQAALVQAAVEWLKSKGSGPYQIQTWGDTDEACAIYESLGFTLDQGSHSIEFVNYV